MHCCNLIGRPGNSPRIFVGQTLGQGDIMVDLLTEAVSRRLAASVDRSSSAGLHTGRLTMSGRARLRQRTNAGS